MSDDDTGQVGERTGEEHLGDVVLGHGVEACRYVVEDHDPSSVSERPRQAHPLGLAAGHRRAAQPGAISVR